MLRIGFRSGKCLVLFLSLAIVIELGRLGFLTNCTPNDPVSAIKSGSKFDRLVALVLIQKRFETWRLAPAWMRTGNQDLVAGCEMVPHQIRQLDHRSLSLGVDNSAVLVLECIFIFNARRKVGLD